MGSGYPYCFRVMKGQNSPVMLQERFFAEFEAWRAHSVGRLQVFIGVSGGADSTLLAHLVKQVSGRLDLEVRLCHFFHDWSEFDKIELGFCGALANRLGLPLIVGTSNDIGQIKPNGSQEELARKQRRAFFKQVCDAYPGAVVALGHNSTDQIETFFVRLARGAGLKGLCGMQYFDAPLLRPLLGFSRENILALIKFYDLEYLQDPDNQNQKRLRNRIRLRLTPRLSEVDERLCGQILRAMINLRQQQEAGEFMFNFSRAALGLTADWVRIENFLELPQAVRCQYLFLRLRELNVKIDPSEATLLEFERFLRSPGSGAHRQSGFQVLKSAGLFSLQGCP